MNRFSRVRITWALGAIVLLVGAGAFGNAESKEADQNALDQQQIEAAGAAYRKFAEAQRAGAATEEDVYRWSRRWADAVSGAATATGQDRVKAAGDHLARMRQLERFAAYRPKTTDAGASLAAVHYYVVEAQNLLRKEKDKPANAIMVIVPYRHGNTWVFDDPKKGLVQEPFVAGIPRMIDWLVGDLPDAQKGFRLLFSAKPFPGYQKKLTWTRAGDGGNYYRVDNPSMEGWLCPALLRYFPAAPREIYVKAEPRSAAK